MVSLERLKINFDFIIYFVISAFLTNDWHLNMTQADDGLGGVQHFPTGHLQIDSARTAL
jgi:hypothetical protein